MQPSKQYYTYRAKKTLQIQKCFQHLQVRNGVKAVRNRMRLSRDAIYNLIELSHDIDFVHHITVHPDLIAILYSPTMLDIFRATANHHLPVQTLSYDTTFTLGDFYVSVLLFRETEFTTSPVMPLAFMLHERKTAETHDLFFRHIKAASTTLQATSNCLIVTDGEQGIVQAIENNLPAVQHLLCFNHVMQDAKRWLRDHGAHSADEVAYYLDCMRTLQASYSEDEYKDGLISYFAKWSQPFAQWFTDHVHPVIDKIGAWRLRPFQMEEATTNQAESFNHVIKQLQVHQCRNVLSPQNYLLFIMMYTLVNEQCTFLRQTIWLCK